MRVISFLAQETRDTVAINYVSSTIETVIHQTPGDEGSLATKPTYEYVQLFFRPVLRRAAATAAIAGETAASVRQGDAYNTQYGTERRP